MSEILILGGGSAGCVLAARLSEDPDRRVTLVEAGRDLTADSMSPHVASRYPGRAYLDPANIWPQLDARMGVGTAPRRYEQGRLLGGGSAINAMVANRGAPGDYDEWGALGAEGWSWEACLPWFRRLERDVDRDGPLHGADGPIPVRRIRDEAMSPFTGAVIETMVRHGHPRRPDQNGAWEDGVFTGVVAVGDDGRRVPVSVAYLTPPVRRRANLRILTGHHAERLVLDGRRVTGAVVAPPDGGPRLTLSADEVIVSAGAIHSAALLLRSGIGPAAALDALGIKVIHERRGVGENLMEHPSIAVSCYLPRRARMTDLDEHHDQAILRFSSGLPGTPPGDMHMAIIARSGWHKVGQRIGTLFAWVNKSYARGRVSLRSPDPGVEPEVDFRLLSDRRDLERLTGAFRLGASILSDPGLRRWAGPAFPTSYSPRVARLAGPGFVNAAGRSLFGTLLDLAGPLRAQLIHGAITLGVRLDRLLADDAALEALIAQSVGGVWHASGTCRMGAATDPMAVTDGAGRVHGLERLRVCDASLMPTIPRANTNLPTIMMAERIAGLIRAA